MTRCQSELDPVVVARCDARRRREDETGCLLLLVSGRPFPRSAVLGIWERTSHEKLYSVAVNGRGQGDEGLQMAMLRCRSGRLSMFCSEPCMSGASRFRPSEVL